MRLIGILLLNYFIPGIFASYSYANYCALSRWFLDARIKGLLNNLWRCRATIVGTFIATKSTPALIRIAPTSSFANAIAKQNSPVAPFVTPPKCYWKQWIILPPREDACVWSHSSRKASNCNFYVVWEGRLARVFYQ